MDKNKPECESCPYYIMCSDEVLELLKWTKGGAPCQQNR